MPSNTVSSPDYVGLVSFLLKPFLDDPQSLHIDCEQLPSTKKIWLRVAFDVTEKGKVFGRGGRNIQAIRTLLETTAANVNQSIYLDVYDDEDSNAKDEPHSKYDSGREKTSAKNLKINKRRNDYPRKKPSLN
ncbi:MAG: KH domain-containing protein [Xenococcaceae cyanobacterium MO_207.B15]|nr:KH domain-containing protein [Xenococcaceae cyanobacterium MO_207.B15]MDJ0746973.1 KH domain-containing protein [Xenococcaceae cyanobacterium MO_167.B27]